MMVPFVTSGQAESLWHSLPLCHSFSLRQAVLCIPGKEILNELSAKVEQAYPNFPENFPEILGSDSMLVILGKKITKVSEIW